MLVLFVCLFVFVQFFILQIFFLIDSEVAMGLT